jgi:hypothetical protein
VANVTITVDEQLLKRARLRARREGTSVNRLLRERLESYVNCVKGDQRRRKAIRELLQLSRAARSGSGGRPVRREDLYGE